MHGKCLSIIFLVVIAFKTGRWKHFSMSLHNKYAYVLLVMKGDAYVPGAIAMAESIRMSGSSHDIVCMVTPDVSEQARTHIATVARVHPINYLRYRTKRMKSRNQMSIYGSWFTEAYTKARSLELTEYEKVLFVDADMIAVNNIDHLFTLQAPAGTFSSPWAREYAPESCFGLDGYPKEHGATVSASAVRDTLSRGGGYTMIASMILLEPDLQDFNRFCTMVGAMQPFGLDNWSAPDEQSLVYYFGVEKGVNWTHIHQRYNMIIHKPRWLGDDVPHVLHYFKDKKPWMAKQSFRQSPYATDRVWWYVLRQWWLRTRRELLVARYDEMKRSDCFTIGDSPQTRTLFPWISSLRERFPELFSKN